MKESSNQSQSGIQDRERRNSIKRTAIGAGALATLPAIWHKPVINAIVLPAHAQTSALNIVQIAAGNADFTTLVGALGAANLVSTLEGPGPFTVFAPTNAAFDAISATVATLSVADLTDILLYHVLSGVQPPSAIPSTSGAPASVVATVQASNGVIYVIDQVLIP